MVPDLLSRHVSSETLAEHDINLCKETEYSLDLVISDLPATDRGLDKIKQAQANDPVCQVLSELCQRGWPRQKRDASEIGLLNS